MQKRFPQFSKLSKIRSVIAS